jgi:hypothetical protein
MTKDDFLRDPVRLLWAENRTVPNDWITAAWSIEPFRENVTYELIRSVRKNGDFFIAQYWLQILPQILTEPQAIELYQAIRDHSHRYEDEWREEFETAFRQFADKLPPPQVQEQSDEPVP